MEKRDTTVIDHGIETRPPAALAHLAGARRPTWRYPLNLRLSGPGTTGIEYRMDLYSSPEFTFLVAELQQSSAFTNNQLYERVAERMRAAGLPYSEALRLAIFSHLQYLIEQQGVAKESRLERGATGRKVYYSGTEKLRTSTISPPQSADETPDTPAEKKPWWKLW